MAAADSIGAAVAMKIVSPDIMHKSDAGGIALNLTSGPAVRKAFKQIMANAEAYRPDADIRGALIAPMAQRGVEVIIGTKTDDQFGPVIMYGLGGIMVEILKDVAFRVLPLSRHGAKKLIEETKSFPILDGVRGTPASDKNALVRLLLTCSELMEAYPDIVVMDLNPVFVHPQGCRVLDARILLTES